MSAKPFEFDLKDCGHVQSAELDWGLDAPAKLTIRLSITAEKRRDLTIGSLPKAVDFKCQGKAMFAGLLHSVRSLSTHTFELEYRDASDRLSRETESEFIKGQRLEDFLGTVARLVGLRPRFFGKFSHELPALDLGGKSYAEHLARLGSEFGFHYTVHSSSKEMLFVALGASRESGEVKAETLVDFRSSRTAACLFGAAEVLAFDSHEGKPKKIEIAPAAIYESLGFLKEAGSFDAKARLGLANGRMETVSPSSRDPQKFRDSVTFALSKQALGGETLTLGLASPVGFPGDRLEVKNAPEKSVEGKYLVSRVRTRVQSAVPVHEVTLVRA